MGARLALFRATGKREDLLPARRLLDDLRARNPGYRDSMLGNVRMNREIDAEARAAGL